MNAARQKTDGASPRHASERDLLACYLSLVWVVLTVYGSLYPFSGWRGDAVDAFVWLNLQWPYYWTGFDLVLNVLVYLPLGLFVTLALRRLPALRALYLAVLVGAALSFSLETLQNWLPSRVASNLDLACNTLGTLAGGLIALWIGAHFAAIWRLWRQRLIAPLPHVDLGLTLLGLWLLIQLSPEILLFGVGDLRQHFDLFALDYGPRRYRISETAVIFCNLIAVGLFVSLLSRGRWLALFTVPLFFLLAGLIRALGAAVLAGPENWLAWLTLGTRHGLAAGSIALLLGLFLPPRGRLGLAALFLCAGTALVNLTPLNPYSTTAFELWQRGHFLNFNGLTRWLAIVWPFAVLPYLIWLFRKMTRIPR
ncbi:MAG: VanZ family protein [Zoogloeaceae bacterium]|jgi:VanZ family protein|nr:VanZ family protein [Zoogloeaceae bacterium]